MSENAPCGDTMVHTIVMDDVRIEGLAQVPVYNYAVPPAPATPCMIVRLHQPIETRIIRWTATRVGGPPDMPSPASLDANNIFLRGGRTYQTAPPDNAGVTYEYTVSGFYEYALISPRGLDSDMLGCKLPWDSANPSYYTIPAAKFRKDLLDVPPQAPIWPNPLSTGS